MTLTATAIDPQIVGNNPAELCRQVGDFSSKAVGDMASLLSDTSARKVRAVITSMFAYTAAAGILTASATGAMASQDGVSLVAGDSFLMPEGTGATTGADAGPYDLTTPGTATTKAAAARPSWWSQGSTIPLSATVTVGPEGTLFGGTAWKTFSAKGKVVGTDAPLMYPARVAQSVTLAAGLITIANVPIRGAGKTIPLVVRTTAGGTLGASYQQSALTAGAIGTGSIQIAAQTTTGATSTLDTSTLTVEISNF